MSNLLVGTDFSGLGSPEEALKRLNISHSIEFACERDKYARQSYEANHKPKIFYDDVTTRDNSKAGYVDLYVFGFPCQAFSNAGKRLGFQDTRGTLFFNSLDYITQNRPLVFVAENVKGLLSHDKKKGTKGKYGNTFNTIIDCLAVTANGQYNLHKYEDCVNYHVFYMVHNTKNYGVPQNRERIFIVGFRDIADAEAFRFNKGFELILRLKDLLQDNPDQKYFLTQIEAQRVLKYNGKYTNVQEASTASTASTLMSRYPGNQNGNFIIYPVDEKYYLSDKMISCLTNHSEVQKQKGNSFKSSFLDPNTANTANTVKANYAKMPGDADYIIVDNYNNQKELILAGNIEGMYDSRSRVYSPDVISPTLLTKTGGGGEIKIKTFTRIRRLTPRECFRLQGYTDSFFDNCAAIQSDTQLYKQAGNSITVDTIMYLLKNVLIAIKFNN